MSRGVVFSSEKCTAYAFPGHPERPERISQTLQHLRSKSFTIKEPSPASEKDALRVHDKGHLDQVKKGGYRDPDTPHNAIMYEMALLSLGGALASARSARDGTPAFSLMRPPGHHAGTISGVSGFCYFNNIAVSVTELLESYEKIAILDVDVHHGNGTQEIIQGNERVLFCSLQQIPLYPGTGFNSEGNCLNFPVSPGTGEDDYLDILDQALVQLIEFRPQALAVSAGFDTYREDPLANLALDVGTYEKIGSRAAALGIPRYALLEGGYSPDLPLCIESFLKGFF